MSTNLAAAIRTRDRLDLNGVAALSLGLIVALAIVRPFVRGGWVVLLDYGSGPRTRSPTSVLGMNGALVASGPFELFVHLMERGLLRLGPVLVLGLPLPVAAIAAWVLLRPYGRLALVGVAAYVLNPFVWTRLDVGQVGVLMAYALTPLALAILRASRKDPTSRRNLAASLLIWFAGPAAAVQQLWVFLVLAAIVALTPGCGKRRTFLVTQLAALGLADAYLVVGLGGTSSVGYIADQLAVFQTRGTSAFAALGNAFSLRGFWRGGDLPLTGVSVVLGLGLLALFVGLGLLHLGRTAKGIQVLALLVVGALLSLGGRGPLGSGYRLAMEHLPGFAVMREPQKWAVLVALAYAELLPAGVRRLALGVPSLRAVGGACAAVALLFTTPTLVSGLGGRLRPVSYPPSWQAAAQLSESRPGAVLALPWHRYISLDFTGSKVGNPMAFAFTNDVLIGDNIEIGPIRTLSTAIRSAYVEEALELGSSSSCFGARMSAIGVGFVALATAADTSRYAWLDQQRDLTAILRSPSMVLYRNDAFVGPPVSASPALTAGTPSAALVLRCEGESRPLSVRPPGITAAASADAIPPSISYRRRSPWSIKVRGRPTESITIPVSADARWTSSTAAVSPSPEGSTTVTLRSTGATLVDHRPLQIISCYAAFGLTLLAVLLAPARLRRHRHGRDLEEADEPPD